MAPRAACRSGFHPLPLQTVREVLPHTAFRQPSPGCVRGVEGAYSRQIEVFHSALGKPVLELRHRQTSSETVAGSCRFPQPEPDIPIQRSQLPHGVTDDKVIAPPPDYWV